MPYGESTYQNLLAYNGPSIVDGLIDQVPTQGICSSGSTAAGSCFRTTPQGFPTNFASPSFFNTLITQVRYIPENERTPYVQTWHFTIQREIAKDLLLDVGYVGNHSVGLIILGDENQAVPNQVGSEFIARRAPSFPEFQHHRDLL